MRTTLDIDETVLAAARALARSQNISLGKAVSDLAMRGLRPDLFHTDASTMVDVDYAHFPVYSGGPTVTDDMVSAHRDD